MKENANSDIFKICPRCGNEYHGVGAQFQEWII